MHLWVRELILYEIVQYYTINLFFQELSHDGYKKGRLKDIQILIKNTDAKDKATA